MEKNDTNKIKKTPRRTEQRRFGRAWTTLRVSDSMRRISYTSKQPIHSTESYSKNSIGKTSFYCILFLVLTAGSNRFPLVERAVADVPALADPEFAAGIRRHAQNLLQRSRGNSGAFLPSFLSFFPLF